MHRLVFGLAWVGILVMPEQAVQAQAKDKEPTPKVGEIIIVGNEITQDRVIRAALDLYPGEPLQLSKLRVAERKLARLGLFTVDQKAGIRPTVSVLDRDPPGEFKDILVEVKEGCTGSFQASLQANSRRGLGFVVVLEERNFDPWRWPSSIDDLAEGRAFRGGGKTFYFRIALGAVTRPGVFGSLRKGRVFQLAP